MSEMIFVTWALGPSYRYRMKQFIKYNKRSKSCNDVKYIIFTDKVSDFDYLKDDESVIEINDFHELIESRGFELAHDEYIPRASDEDWAKVSRANWGRFSYPLKRVIFLRLYELNITKFVLIDPDVYVNPNVSKEEILAGLDIPPNSVAVMGRTPLNIYWDTQLNHARMGPAPSMNFATAVDFFRVGYFLLYMIREQVQKKYGYDLPLKEFPLYHTFDISEGIFHYHHFSDKETLLKYFHVWDEAVRFLYSTEYRGVTTGPGWLIPDFTVLCLTNMICDIQVFDADRPVELFYGMVFYEDKYIMPNTNGFMPGNTLEEFAEINKDLLNKEYFNRNPIYGWWNFLKDYNIIDVEKYYDFINNHTSFKSEAEIYYNPSWLTDKNL